MVSGKGPPEMGGSNEGRKEKECCSASLCVVLLSQENKGISLFLGSSASRSQSQFSLLLSLHQPRHYLTNLNFPLDDPPPFHPSLLPRPSTSNYSPPNVFWCNRLRRPSNSSRLLPFCNWPPVATVRGLRGLSRFNIRGTIVLPLISIIPCH